MAQTEQRYIRRPDGSLVDSETGQVILLPTDPGRPPLRDNRRKSERQGPSYRPIRPANLTDDSDALDVRPRSDLLPPKPLRKAAKPTWTWADIIKQVAEEEVELNGETVQLKVAIVRAAFFHALEGNASMLKELFERSEGKMTQNLTVKDASLKTDEMSDDDINNLIHELVGRITATPVQEQDNIVEAQFREYGELPATTDLPALDPTAYEAEPPAPVEQSEQAKPETPGPQPGDGIEFLK